MTDLRSAFGFHATPFTREITHARPMAPNASSGIFGGISSSFESTPARSSANTTAN